MRLGYTAFAPLPDSFFADPKALRRRSRSAPVRSSWTARPTPRSCSPSSPTTPGTYKPNVDKVTFRIYNDDGAAYNDVVANSLDFTDDAFPTDQLVDDLYKTELPDRNGAARRRSVIAATDFSPIDRQPEGHPDLRKAISHGHRPGPDQQADLQRHRVRRLTGWVSPVVDGYKAGACGDACKFNPTEAKKLYDAGRRLQGRHAHHDGATATRGHKPWADAACNSIKNTLGSGLRDQGDARLRDHPQPDRQARAQGSCSAPAGRWTTRRSRTSSHPIYGNGRAARTTPSYSNPKFDAKLTAGCRGADLDEANKLYQEAEAMLGHGLPVACPMWSYARDHRLVGSGDRRQGHAVRLASTSSSVKVK